ncbi:MAG: AIPR family protein [Polyangiaceae bacterium]|nr:AIPR family protein [Polyangiaceae bacterium]
MNINVSIIDQHVRGLVQRLQPRIEEVLESNLDETKARSVAFVVLCVKTLLELNDDEALECLMEGGNDFGIDAMDLSDIVEGEFTVTLFQGKYKHQNLEGNSHFEETGIIKAVQAVRYLFDPSADLHVNPRLKARIEEIRSLIVDGLIPRVRFILCNNGLSWKRPEAQAIIDRENFPPERVQFEHANHDTLVRILQATQPVKDTIQFAGRSVVEDFNFSRVFLGKVAVTEIYRLMESHGDRLLERNIRRYLGLMGNRVNIGIHQTLINPQERPNFFFYNNGITLICQKFDYNALQKENYNVRVEGLQIINGGQTCKTIHAALSNSMDQTNLDSAFVLVRLYQVGGEDATNLVRTITYATNSQNPVDLRDLRSNDPIQKNLELAIQQLGYDYRRQRGDAAPRPTEITSGSAAEAVLSVWRKRPQQAKYSSSEHFGKLYDEIFSKDLNGAQTVIAVLLFRIAENRRKRPVQGAPELVRYASCFAAMLMGQALLADLGITLDKLDHRVFDKARSLVEKKGEEYYVKAIQQLEDAIKQLYGNQPVSLQRLAATFRRGDLMQYLPKGN